MSRNSSPARNALALMPARTTTTRMTNNEVLFAALKSDAWEDLVKEAAVIGLTETNVRKLGEVLINNTKRKDPSFQVSVACVKKLLTSCGIPKSVAAAKIRDALLAVQAVHDFDLEDNQYFHMGASGRLDDKHLSNIFLKRDGLHEVLHSGQDPLSIRIRTFAGGLVRILDEQLDRARRFEQAHRDTESERLDSSQKLKRTIEMALPCGERSARARVRKFNTQEYWALGVVDKSKPEFKTATMALTTVTKEEGIVPRRGGVANNLTIVGKDAIRWMNSAVTQDVVRRQADIDAAPSGEKNRILQNAMSERVMRLKRFNVFHENPAMVGVESATVNAADQAHYYFNQEKDKREFE